MSNRLAGTLLFLLVFVAGLLSLKGQKAQAEEPLSSSETPTEELIIAPNDDVQIPGGIHKLSFGIDLDDPDLKESLQTEILHAPPSVADAYHDLVQQGVSSGEIIQSLLELEKTFEEGSEEERFIEQLRQIADAKKENAIDPQSPEEVLPRVPLHWRLMSSFDLPLYGGSSVGGALSGLFIVVAAGANPVGEAGLVVMASNTGLTVFTRIIDPVWRRFANRGGTLRTIAKQYLFSVVYLGVLIGIMVKLGMYPDLPQDALQATYEVMKRNWVGLALNVLAIGPWVKLITEREITQIRDNPGKIKKFLSQARRQFALVGIPISLVAALRGIAVSNQNEFWTWGLTLGVLGFGAVGWHKKSQGFQGMIQDVQSATEKVVRTTRSKISAGCERLLGNLDFRRYDHP